MKRKMADLQSSSDSKEEILANDVEALNRVRDVALEALTKLPIELSITEYPSDEVRLFLMKVRSLAERATEAPSWDESQGKNLAELMDWIQLSVMVGMRLAPETLGVAEESCTWKCAHEAQRCAETCGDRWECKLACATIGTFCIADCLLPG